MERYYPWTIPEDVLRYTESPNNIFFITSESFLGLLLGPLVTLENVKRITHENPIKYLLKYLVCCTSKEGCSFGGALTELNEGQVRT